VTTSYPVSLDHSLWKSPEIALATCEWCRVACWLVNLL